MIGLLLVLLAALAVAMFMGAQLGRHLHYARGFEAGADHAVRVVRAALHEGTHR